MAAVVLAWSAAAQTVPAARNYIRTYVFADSTGDVGRAREKSQYFDGLGRQVLEVCGATSMAQSYTAVRTEYNASGTVSRKWLPVPGGAECLAPGAVAGLADNFYGGGQYPYTSYRYDSYPLRLSGENGPGAFWKDRTTSHPRARCAPSGEYMCRKVLVGDADGSLSVGAAYGAGELRVDESVDVDGMRTLTFVNSSGRTVLERRIGTDGAVADTRYVYDIRGDLRYAVSPEGCLLMPDSGTVPPQVTDLYAQCFRYDFRHRLISYRLPGCGWEEYVYDRYGNLLLSADAVQRGNSMWTMTLYDSRMRPAVRGSCSFTDMSPEQLRVLFADSAITAGFAGDAGGPYHQYRADGVPESFEPYIAWYYDGYDFICGCNASHRTLFEDGTQPYSAVGMLTGTATGRRTDALYTAFRYDGRGNVVYSEEWDEFLQNHRLSVSSEFDFLNNETARTELYEEIMEQTVFDSHCASFTTVYDDLGRVLSQYLSVDGAAPSPVLENEYDAVGRLSRQWRGTDVEYTYDVRSYLTGSASDIYTERVHYAVDGTAAQSPAWPSYRFANRVEDVWAARGDSLPRVALDWQMYYDGLGRFVRGAVPDGSFAEITEPDLDANIRGVRRVFRGAEIQNAVISYTAGMATGVRDVSSPYYGERAGRFPAGDYSLSYDAAGRLTGDGTRGITGVRYSDWSHIPQSIEADGYKVFTEISPDGKLRSRRVNIPYIETVIKVNADGDTIIRYRERTLSRSCSIYGSFERVSYQNRSHFRVNTAAGFHDITEGRRYWYLTNRQGSVMALVDSEGNVHRRSGLFPGGTPFVIDGDENSVPDMGIPSDRHHIGNRWVGFGGLNWYDNTARMHDPLLMHFTAPDPKATTFLQYSPWSHCAANPANLVDLDGQSTKVMELGNGNYEVIGGDLTDKDKNIYVYKQDEHGGYTVKGQSIGITTSITSFYNSDEGKWAIGSVICPNDMSGDNFLSKIISSNPTLDQYMMNARTGHPYDFKVTNGTAEAITGINIYRGMPIGLTKDGQRVYSSARDIGNIAAGYVAAINGLSWKAARAGFDSYQSISLGRFEIEGVSTQNAERYGWIMGYNNTNSTQRAHNFGNSLVSPIIEAGNYLYNKTSSYFNYIKQKIGF